MGGPWEDYAPRQAAPTGGPWEDYTPKPAEAKRSGTIAESLDAVVRGAANALTFGFADRLAAAAGAATGIGGQKGDYEGNLAKQRAIDTANLQEHPVETFAGNLAGGLAMPVGAMASAPTLAGRMVAGAGLGAGTGALFGVSSSPDLRDVGQVAQNAVTGAGTGALIGGLAPPVVEGAGSLVKGLVRQPANLIQGLRDPEGTAQKLVVDAINRDRATGGAQLTQQAFDEAAARGQPVLTGDLGGDVTRRLARQATNTSAEAGNALKGATYERFQNQGPRIADMVQGLGGGNSTETLDKLQEAARKANKPLYAKAYAEGASGIWNDDLQQLTAAPAVQDAIKGAIKSGANSDIAAGFPATRSPFTVGENGELSLARKPDGSIAVPSLQFWDQVKRNLDDRIETARRAGEKNAASVIGNLKNNLVSILDQASPTYAAARGQAAAAFGAEDALQAGAKFVSAKGQNQEYAKAIAAMSEPEKKLFAHGFLSELENKIGEIGDNRDVTINAMFNSTKSRQRIEMAIGSEKATELEKYLRAESIMMKLKNAVSGNSTTAEQQADLATGLAGGLMAHGLTPRTIFNAIEGFTSHGAHGVNVKVMRKVGELLSSPNPPDQLRALQIINSSPGVKSYLKPFVGSQGVTSAILGVDAERRKASNQ